MRRIQGQDSAAAIANILTDSSRGGGYRLSSGLASLKVESPPKENLKESACSLSGVAEWSEVHPEYIRFLCKVGFLSYRRGNYNSIVIERTDAESFTEAYVFVGPLARALDCSSTNLAEKLQALGIHAVSGPSVDGGLCYLFRRADLQGIEAEELRSMKDYPTRTGRKLKDQPKPEMQGITFGAAAMNLRTTAGAIIRLVSKGILKRAPGRSREQRIDAESLHNLTATLADPQYVSESDAAARLKETKQQLRRRWIDTGLLHVRDLVLVRQCSVAQLEQIVQLKKKYALNSDLAREAGVIRSHFVNQARIGRHPSPRKIAGETASILLFPKTQT